MLAIVTPCKGRLHHLRQTSHRAVRECDLLVVVDYSCQDECGHWVAKTFSPRDAVPCYVPGKRWFNKSEAHNAGARLAIEMGATILCFVDADTIIKPGFSDWVVKRVSPGRFCIANTHPDLTGFLGTTPEDFTGVNGYDGSYDSWGGEDLDMRIRLRLAGCNFGIAPENALEPIEHSDAERTANYEVKHKPTSSVENLNRVFRRFHEVTGDPVWYYKADMQVLLGGAMTSHTNR